MATILNKKSQPEEGNRTYLIREQDVRALNEIIEAAIQDNATVSDKVEGALEVLAANIRKLVGITDLARKEGRNNNQLDPITVASMEELNPNVKLQPIQHDPDRVAPIGSLQTLPRMKNR